MTDGSWTWAERRATKGFPVSDTQCPHQATHVRCQVCVGTCMCIPKGMSQQAKQAASVSGLGETEITLFLLSATCEAFRRCNWSGQINRKQGRRLGPRWCSHSPYANVWINRLNATDSYLGSWCVLVFSHTCIWALPQRKKELLTILSTAWLMHFWNMLPNLSWMHFPLSALKQHLFTSSLSKRLYLSGAKQDRTLCFAHKELAL